MTDTQDIVRRLLERKDGLTAIPPEWLFDEVAAEITRLRAQVKTADAEGYARAREQAKIKALNFSTNIECDYLSSPDPETGVMECSKTGDCLCQERIETADNIYEAISAMEDVK